MAKLGGLMVVPILCLIAYDIQVASSGGYPNPWDEAHTLFLVLGLVGLVMRLVGRKKNPQSDDLRE